MVAIQSRLDDVLLALKGKKVEATHQVRRTVPSMCTENRKSQPITLDVSPEGERELEKLDKRFREHLLEAGRVYGKLQDTRTEARAAKPKQKPKTVAPEPAQQSEMPSEESADTAEENPGPAHDALAS